MKLTLPFLGMVCASFAFGFPSTSTAADPAHTPQVSIPLTFERNQGQAPPAYRYISRHQGVQAFFTGRGPDFLLPSPRSKQRVVSMRFAGSSTAVQIDGAQALPGRDNYLVGAECGKWITGIPTYSEVRYRNLYPGIDLVFHGQADKARLEHDFIIAPHSDLGKIEFGFGDSVPMRITPAGKLLIGENGHQLVFDPPQAWQTSGSLRIAVASSFVMKSRHTVGFRVRNYDSSRPLTIDPVLQYATYLDGTAQDSITDIATDPTGNVYVTGWTYSTDFPTSNAEQSKLSTAPDAFIAKLDPT
ncbi:MAG TPA: SBBP repeat-containing protein, partial [Terracidiphilus sp.]